jgi:hypothetical protein
MQQVEGAGVQHFLSTFSSPCFGVKTVYNYGHWLATYFRTLEVIEQE